MLRKKLENYNVILASKSPRRKFLLKQLGINFKIRTKDTEESYPKNLKGKQIPIYLSKKKAAAFKNELKPNDLLITADTIVWIKGKILNKPENPKEATRMLKLLSGKMHTVYTGVCIAFFPPTKKNKKQNYRELKFHAFSVSTNVFFKKLTAQELTSYIQNHQPFDKAGSYGAQECLPIGINPCSKAEMVFLEKIKNVQLAKNSTIKRDFPHHVPMINKISGSYFNVMGLPIVKLFENLNKF